MPGASDLFAFLTLEQVLAIQAKAASMLSEGKTVMSWGSEGKSGSKQFTMPVNEVLAECVYRLRQLGYQGQRIVRRVRGDFSRGVR